MSGPALASVPFVPGLASQTPEADPNRVQLRVVEVCRTEGGEAPEWIQLTYGEGDYEARDGRKLHIKSARALVREFNKRTKADGVQASIDWDHSEHSYARFFGGRSPAAGWIEKLEVREDGAIWANVEWSAQGRKDVEELAYRYISPALAGVWKERKTGTRDDGQVETEYYFQIESILNAGLVNNPALRMEGLFAAQPQPHAPAEPFSEPVQPTEAPMTTETITMSKAILALLSLSENGTEAEAIKAIQALKAEADKVEPERLKREAAESRVQALEAEALTAKATAKVDAAVAAHKITPGQRDAMVRLACTDSELFDEIVAAATPIAAGVSELDGKPAPGGKAHLSAGQKDDIAAVLKARSASKEALAASYQVELAEIQAIATSVGLA